MGGTPQLKIEIKIGDTEKRVFVLVKTTAPIAFDAFGALITLKSYLHLDRSVKHSWREGSHRYVLIPLEYLSHHKGRYAAALHTAEIVEDQSFVRKWVEDILWERLSSTEVRS